MDARLLLIGGAAGPALLIRFVELAGSASARIVVIATASAEPAVAEESSVGAFRQLGAGSVRALRLASRADANAPAAAAALREATGIFFTGGDQRRITTVLGGTATDSLLQELVAGGTTVLGGTSAGAAMMSATMIIGGDGPGVTAASVQTGPGLEFLPGVLIDQHFAQRGRLNRLLSAVALYPHELGLGIDEDTAILTDGDRFEVLGSGAVTVVDAGAATDIRVPPSGPIALAGVRVHVLPAGHTFHLTGRRPGIGDTPHEDREPAPPARPQRVSVPAGGGGPVAPGGADRPGDL
ncbi:peptidase S51 [Actinoplanes sp. SE50]|uniref:cyanophycinase n=1 Tax=unclassified Actinoplanes TaxID=2626549 RepID=UPI00023EBC40|nr:MULTISPECIES: cyanophycinase [unclassified Actinoplanes]AEV87403.1 cyanophycinase [Actinoplanes sp. SE50/110]ATO85805.1 peptidase S51 [Actinoplanes sp. SE50]SLM03218.1 Cyanophycinase [Actinoplanes sp. SE50/110]